MSAEAPDPPKRETAGFHIAKGVALQLSGFAIRVDENGELKLDIPTVNLRLDTLGHWLEIAMDHLAAAKLADARLEEVRDSGSGALDFEPVFKSSMQAIVASATFFEAVYAASRDRMPPGRQAQLSADGSGARRSGQVTEQLKRAFGLKPRHVDQLRDLLSRLYVLRDAAVHPSASFAPSEAHPQFGVFVEQRFARYTFPVAKFSVRVACAYCKILAVRGAADGPKEIHELAQYMQAIGDPIFLAWESAYGPLLDA